MPVRLQEIHPSLVHLPMTLLPLAVGADALGRATGNQSLRDVGRWAMPLAAASAAVLALFGLIAQEEVKAEGRAAATRPSSPRGRSASSRAPPSRTSSARYRTRWRTSGAATSRPR